MWPELKKGKRARKGKKPPKTIIHLRMSSRHLIEDCWGQNPCLETVIRQQHGKEVGTSKRQGGVHLWSAPVKGEKLREDWKMGRTREKT